jgi:hypothetical protein
MQKRREAWHVGPTCTVHVSTQSTCHVSRLTHVMTFRTSHELISKFSEVDVHFRS